VARTISACGAFCERSARSFAALIAVASLVSCSSGNGLPTQRAYNLGNIEQPQAVGFYCGTIVAVEPAILPNGIPPGVGITPSIGPWLLGLHAWQTGPNATAQVSAGFLDLNGIASAPEAPLTEYTIMLNNGEPIIVVQSDLPQLYPNDYSPGHVRPTEPVGVRVVGSTGRVMRNTALPCTPGPLQTIQASYPIGVTHSFLGSGGVVYMYYPSGAGDIIDQSPAVPRYVVT
jgi:hypothetical protein